MADQPKVREDWIDLNPEFTEEEKLEISKVKPLTEERKKELLAGVIGALETTPPI